MADIPSSFMADAGSRFCPECGYNLHGIASERCPECGLRIDSDLVLSRIPWSHRRQIGAVRAFYRTVILATFKPRRLAGASAGSVDFAASQHFRWVVVLLASLPLIAGLFVLIQIVGGGGFLNIVGPNPLEKLTSWPPTGSMSLDLPWQLAFIWSAGITLGPVASVAIFLMFLFCTGVCRYWFHPESLPIIRQNRAMAVSNYACAPLALFFIPLIAAVGFKLEVTSNVVVGLTCLVSLCVFYFGVPIILLLYWWNTLRMLAGTTHCGLGRLIVAGVTLPLLWAGCAVVALGVFPAVAGFIWLMIDSLR